MKTSSPDPSAPLRCSWCETNPLLRAYHDAEWGVPERDSRTLWEKLMLDGFQAGLSWLIVLKRRDGFRRAFQGFDPAIVAAFTQADVDRLVLDDGIIKSRAKIEATIGNARAYLAMQAAGEDFSEFVWGMAGGEVIMGTDQRTTQTPVSEAISKALRKRGFKFVGPVIVYAWMQAVGIVNDHHPDCFRHSA